jgi:pyruvate dehydrogenase E1 component
VIEAPDLLAEKYGVASDVWSVTSYTQLRREAQECRHKCCIQRASPQKTYLEQ